MSYDLYLNFPCKGQVDSKIVNNPELDIPTKVTLLAGLRYEARKELDRTSQILGSKYRSLVLAQRPSQTHYNETIRECRKILEKVGIWKPDIPDCTVLPAYSTFLQFQFTLATSYLSRDDEEFYIIDNPVRKDKVFKVPLISGSAWKGNLRHTAQYLALFAWNENPKKIEDFAEEYARLCLLFGNETDNEIISNLKSLIKDDESATKVLACYRERMREYVIDDNTILTHKGYLHFYPTFFDLIDLEVINPHNRQTRAGTKPIYFESVPAGTKGYFSLLYVPYGDINKELVQKDLSLVTKAIKEMMLTYGFSAKKSSGFGATEANLDSGRIVTNRGEWPVTSLFALDGEIKNVQWR